MADQFAGAPGSLEEVKAALASLGSKSYAVRKQVKDWLRDDKDGAKAAWLKGG